MPRYKVFIGHKKLFERTIALGQYLSARRPYPETNFGKYNEETGYITVITDKSLTRGIRRQSKELDPNPSFLSRILRRN